MRQAIVFLIMISCLSSCSRPGCGSKPGSNPDEGCENNTYCKERCDRGDSKACLGLGEDLRAHAGIAGNIEKAITAYRSACEAQEPEACVELAELMEVGHGLPTDEVGAKKHFLKAAKLFELRCQAKDAESCLGLASLYEEGKGVELDEARRREILGMACTLDAEKCWDLAHALEFYEPVNIDEALRYYDGGCKAGCDGCELSCEGIIEHSKDATAVERAKERLQEFKRKSLSSHEENCNFKNNGSACLAAARDLLQGQIVAKNEVRAKEFINKAIAIFEKECEPPKADCFSYGMMYEYGRVTAKDLTRAAFIYERGCKQGNGLDCESAARVLEELGLADETRLGLARDAACRQFTNPEMCRNAGLMFLNGYGVPKDARKADESFQRAVRLYMQNCEHPGYKGHVSAGDSCVSLGILYREGLGVKKNPELAEELIKRGCAAEASSDECDQKAKPDNSKDDDGSNPEEQSEQSGPVPEQSGPENHIEGPLLDSGYDCKL